MPGTKQFIMNSSNVPSYQMVSLNVGMTLLFSERKKLDNDTLELFCGLFRNILAVPNPDRKRYSLRDNIRLTRGLYLRVRTAA